MLLHAPARRPAQLRPKCGIACQSIQSGGEGADILGFAPPLCLTRQEADIVVMATRDAIEDVAAGLRR